MVVFKDIYHSPVLHMRDEILHALFSSKDVKTCRCYVEKGSKYFFI